MDTQARWDLVVWRNDDTWSVPLRYVGADLTGVALLAQIRLAGDTPTLLLALPGIALGGSTTATGVRLVSVTTSDGVPISTLAIQIAKADRQALPYMGEVGDTTVLAWGLTLGGITRIQGQVLVPAQVVGAGAPASRPQGYGSPAVYGGSTSGATLTVAQDGGATLVVDGAGQLGMLIKQAQDAVAAGGQIVADATAAKAAAQTAAGQAGVAAGAVLEAAFPMRNLADPSKFVTDHIVVLGTGVVGPAGGWNATGYLAVPPDGFTANLDIYNPGSPYGVAFYSDTAGTYVGGQAGVAAGTHVANPTGAPYARFSVNGPLTGLKVAGGSTDPNTVGEYGVTDPGQAYALGSQAARARQPLVVDLFVKADARLNYLVAAVNGNGGAANGFFMTAPIPVVPGGKIVSAISMYPGHPAYGPVWIKRDGSYILGTVGGITANQEITVPAGAVAVLLPGEMSNLGKQVVTDRALTGTEIIVGWTDLLNKKPLAGRRVATIGDSIMQNSAVASNGSFFQPALNHYARSIGAIQAGIAGRKLVDVLDGVPVGYPGGTGVDFVAADFANIDLVFCNAATNSWGAYGSDGVTVVGSRLIGALGDMTDPNDHTKLTTGAPATYYGDLYLIYVTKLLTWTSGRFVQLSKSTPLRRFNANSAASDPETQLGNPLNANGVRLSAYRDADVDFCNHFGIACLDLFNMSGLNAANWQTLTVDGLHPNELFYYAKLIPMIVAWWDSLVGASSIA